MIRKGDFKYVYGHGADEQLFDLRDDLGEWHNLAGDPAHQGIQAALRQQFLSHFDPAAIDRAVRISQERRLLLKDAMSRGKPTRWDYRLKPTDVDPAGVAK